MIYKVLLILSFLSFLRGIIFRILNVVEGGFHNPCCLFVLKLPHNLSRHAQDKTAGRYNTPFSNKCAGAYYGLLTYLCAVKYYSAHADKAFPFYDASVQCDIMSYCNIISEDYRIDALCAVQYAVILDVCPLAKFYVMDIAAQNSIAPYACIFAYLYITDYMGAFFNICC